MPELKAARKELQRAAESRDQLKSAANLVELDSRWRETLRLIERCWNKTQAEMRPNSKWQGWTVRGEIEAQRRSDPLLCYLYHARGADEHGIAELTLVKPGHLTINPETGSELHIERMTIVDGKITELKAKQPVSVTFEPNKFVLAPVVNRGVTYPVPTEHLGVKLPTEDPVAIASVGIVYYANVLRRIGSEFLT